MRKKTSSLPRCCRRVGGSSGKLFSAKSNFPPNKKQHNSLSDLRSFQRRQRRRRCFKLHFRMPPPFLRLSPINWQGLATRKLAPINHHSSRSSLFLSVSATKFSLSPPTSVGSLHALVDRRRLLLRSQKIFSTLVSQYYVATST